MGVGVLGYWTRNAVTYRALLLDSLMLEAEGGDNHSTPVEDDETAKGEL